MRSGQGDPDTLPREDARAFFDAVASYYDRVYALDGEAHRSRMRRLASALGAPTDALVLGVGTGRELPTLLDAGFVTTGLDCSPRMLARCADRARHGTLVEGDFWRPLPFGAESFGAVVALHGTLAHPPSVEAPARLAAELARVLRPGGRVFLELPSRAWFACWAGVDAGGAGVLAVEGERAIFVDRRSGVAIRGAIVAPEQWVEALAPHFACALHAFSDDEACVVAERRDVGGEAR